MTNTTAAATADGGRQGDSRPDDYHACPPAPRPAPTTTAPATRVTR